MWIWLTGPSGLYRNSPQGLNISSIRVFEQIRDPEIPINLHPLLLLLLLLYCYYYYYYIIVIILLLQLGSIPRIDYGIYGGGKFESFLPLDRRFRAV